MEESTKHPTYFCSGKDVIAFVLVYHPKGHLVFTLIIPAFVSRKKKSADYIFSSREKRHSCRSCHGCNVRFALNISFTKQKMALIMYT